MASNGYQPRGPPQQHHQWADPYAQYGNGRQQGYTPVASPGGHGRGQDLYDGSGYGEHEGYGYEGYGQDYSYGYEGQWDHGNQRDPYSAGSGRPQDNQYVQDQAPGRTYHYDERYRTNGREATQAGAAAMQSAPTDARKGLPSHEAGKKQKRERILTDRPPSPKAVPWDNPFGVFPGTKKDLDSKKTNESSSRTQTPTPSTGGSRPPTSQGTRSRSEQPPPPQSPTSQSHPRPPPAQHPVSATRDARPLNSGTTPAQPSNTNHFPLEPIKTSLPNRPAPQRATSGQRGADQYDPRFPPTSARSYDSSRMLSPSQVPGADYDSTRNQLSSPQENYDQGPTETYTDRQESYQNAQAARSPINQHRSPVNMQPPEHDPEMPNFAAIVPGKTESVEQEVTMQKPAYQKHTYQAAPTQTRSNSKPTAQISRGGTPADNFQFGFVSREQTPISAISDRGISPPISNPAVSPPIERQQVYQTRSYSNNDYQNRPYAPRTATPARQTGPSFQHPYNQPPVPDMPSQRTGEHTPGPHNPHKAFSRQDSLPISPRDGFQGGMDAGRHPDRSQPYDHNYPRNDFEAGARPNNPSANERQHGYDNRLLSGQGPMTADDRQPLSELPASEPASRNRTPFGDARQQQQAVRPHTATTDSYSRTTNPTVQGHGQGSMYPSDPNLSRSAQHGWHEQNDQYGQYDPYMDDYGQEPQPDAQQDAGGGYPFHPDDYKHHHVPTWNVTSTSAPRHPQPLPHQPRHGSLPHSDASHPAPVRPGLMEPPPQGPPRGLINQPESKQPVQGLPSGKEIEKPVTVAELNKLREMFRTNPNNHTLGLKFAKRLVEAAKVLANENGRADPKQTAKNRERYVLDAHRVIKKMVSAGSPDAMFYLADCYGQGSLGLQPDAKEAFNLYQSAAKIGHAQSAYRVAVCCELGATEGGGTRRDHVKAVQYYKRAATLGDPPAMYKMGMILLKGLLGHPPNPREGISWLKRAAERADAENPHALHELALLYESAKSTDIVLRDEAYAVELFTRAADLGYKYSQFRLGSAYEYGLLRCPIDPRQSIMWYTRAAAQGEHQAEFALSGWYLTGSPPLLEQNDTEAYLWARKSASSGLAKAEYAMGYYSEVGIGVQSDMNEAKKWYYRAAAQKHPKAQERLEELNRGGGRMQKQKVSRSAVGSQHEGECIVM